MRSALIVSFLAAIAILPIGIAAAADTPADKSAAAARARAIQPSANSAVQPTDCTREPVVAGRQLQPRPSELACLNGGKPLQPTTKAQQVDKDEAEIMSFIKRSANQPPLEGAER